MTIRTIPPGLSFVDTLAAGLLAEAAGDPLVLAGMEVLLPTRRACRSLRDAFLRASGGAPLLLPVMRPLGDLDEEELELGADDPLDLSPAMPALDRLLVLTRLVMAMGAERGGRPPAPDQAARLAGELGRLLDAVQAEGLDFSGLQRLVPDDFAAHWQVTLEFLKILTIAWPAILAERGALDAEQRQTLIIAARTEQWRRHPPAHRVVAAGSTGSRPAVAELLGAVAALPTGLVVLPGLDTAMDEASWHALDPAHPQYGMKKLLERLRVERAAVGSYSTEAAPRAARLALVAEALRPAATCEAWRDLPRLPPELLDGVVRLDAPGPREEAGAIALMLREALQTEGRTAALITPDRGLARRVAAELQRWDIAIDDSAGRPLDTTEPGVFLRLACAMVAEDFAPHATLACLKHPLAAGGRDVGAFRALVRRLEREVLRGPRPAPGMAGLIAAAKGRLGRWLDELEAMAAPFAAAMAADVVAPTELVRLHMEFAETLAADDRLPGPARLWRGEAGEALARFAAELAQAAATLPSLPPACWPALFDELLAGRVVRSAWDRHPRLFIWGPLEARLQHADLMVLGGLNEGTWPPQASADPWMSRPMRQAFGLPPHERRIGLSAHDFVQALGAPRVVLTRSARMEGTPTVPSRWLLRLEAVMQATGLTFREDAGQWLEWHGLLDRPERVAPPARPAPRPPLEARPRRLSVTEIETWMRDPYGIYARHILGLRALDPIDADPGAADYGSMVHDALERFLKQYPGPLPPDAEARLLAIGREVFEAAVASPAVWAFWWPRFVSVARWVTAVEAERRPRLAAVHAEVKGALEIQAPGGPFTLVAKADRIDVLRDGGLAVVDYKTGQPPSAKEVAAGYAPQLPLEAVMARHGAFPGIAAGEPVELSYWRLKGGVEGGEEKSAGDDPRRLADEALEGLHGLIAAFDDPATPYEARPHPERAPKYSDYLHLARVREWATAGEEGEE
jgi:ATP-dependent helicase/nuclease subunit B